MSEQQAEAPVFSIEKIYLKDLSLEIPGAPQVFSERESPKIDVNRSVSIQHIFRKYEEQGRFDSPRVIEAAAYMLAKRRDPELER